MFENVEDYIWIYHILIDLNLQQQWFLVTNYETENTLVSVSKALELERRKAEIESLDNNK